MTETEATRALDRVGESLLHAVSGEGRSYYIDYSDSTQPVIKDLTLIKEALKELAVYKLAYEWKFNGVEGTYKELLDKARNTVEDWYKIDEQGYGEVVE